MHHSQAGVLCRLDANATKSKLRRPRVRTAGRINESLHERGIGGRGLYVRGTTRAGAIGVGWSCGPPLTSRTWGCCISRLPEGRANSETDKLPGFGALLKCGTCPSGSLLGRSPGNSILQVRCWPRALSAQVTAVDSTRAACLAMACLRRSPAP